MAGLWFQSLGDSAWQLARQGVGDFSALWPQSLSHLLLELLWTSWSNLGCSNVAVSDSAELCEEVVVERGSAVGFCLQGFRGHISGSLDPSSSCVFILIPGKSQAKSLFPPRGIHCLQAPANPGRFAGACGQQMPHEKDFIGNETYLSAPSSPWL